MLAHDPRSVAENIRYVLEARTSTQQFCRQRVPEPMSMSTRDARFFEDAREGSINIRL